MRTMGRPNRGSALAVDISATYIRTFAGLADLVAGCQPSPAHTNLVRAVALRSELRSTRLAHTEGGMWLARRSVVDLAGVVVADDHEAWLAAQVEADSGDAAVTHRRLKDAGFRLTKTDITHLYLAACDDTDPAKFIQLEVRLEDERLDSELLDPLPWRTISNAADLIHSPGDALVGEERKPVRPAAYRWLRAIDVEAWLATADALEQVRRDAFRQRRYTVTEWTGSEESRSIRTADELFPGWDGAPPRHRRLFLDWERSSACRSGERLCDHWALKLTDYTAPSGERTMTLIPAWAFRRPIAKVDAAKGSDYEFYGRLEKLDRRVGVPFGWYFFALHGNRVEADAIERVIRAAESGTIVLPEHDYRVLKDWQSQPYGF